MYQNFIFRPVEKEEAEQAVAMENVCFPPNEVCSRDMILSRIDRIPDYFLVAEDRDTGKLAAFLSGIATDEERFRDEFFSDAGLHNPDGKNIMILGLNVLPAYRRRGLAREMMRTYLRREYERGRDMVKLTCLPSKIEMYEKMGFTDEGLSNSTWGGELWHEMSHRREERKI